MRTLDRVGLVESGCVLRPLGSRLLSNAMVAAAVADGQTQQLAAAELTTVATKEAVRC